MPRGKLSLTYQKHYLDLGSEKSSAGMEFLRSVIRNSTILQIDTLKSLRKKTIHVHHKLTLTSLRFDARCKFLFPQRSSIGETRSDQVTRNALAARTYDP